MLALVGENRLKISSGLCVLADALMGLSGASGLYHSGAVPGNIFLTVAGILGLTGHSINILWGKGGKTGNTSKQAFVQKNQPPIFLRPLFFWRYPMDASFAIFVVGAVALILSGVFTANPPLAIFGVMALTASLFGWLWPDNKPFLRFGVIQICAMIYMISAISAFASGLWARSLFMSIAGCCYISSNVLLYTVRKENQSRFTIQRSFREDPS